MSPSLDPPPSGEPTRLNILALPSYTAILFGLITLVVLGAAFTSLLPGSQLWWPPMVLGLILLTLRDYLRRPLVWMRRQRLTPVDTVSRSSEGESNQRLAVRAVQNELIDLAGDSRPPLVTVSPRKLAIHTFGTGRQRYMGIGEDEVAQLAGPLLKSTGTRRLAVRAILAHELAHFLNRDISMMWFSYSLLKMMILVMLANLWVSFALSLFIIQVGPEVLQPAFWDELAQFLSGMLPGLPPPDLSWVLPALERQSPEVFARLADPDQGVEVWTPFFLFQVSTYLPFIVSGVVLFGLFWRRLLRVRELYADARAASLMGDGKTVFQGLVLHTVKTRLTNNAPKGRPSLRRVSSRMRDRLTEARLQFALHPDQKQRKICLDTPQRVFGSWRSIAISAGLAVVMMELVLRSALTAGLLAQPAAHLAFAAGFLVFSLWLLPQWCLGRQRDAHLRRVVLGMVLLYTAIKIAPYVLDLLAVLAVQATNPDGWGLVIDLWVYGMLGIMGDNLPRVMGEQVSWAEFILWHILTPMIYFSLVMPVVLVVWLWLDSVLKRRVLTWYSLGNRVRRIWWSGTAVLTGVLLLLVVPITSRILFPWAYASVTSVALAGMIGGFALASIGCAAFILADRRLAGRCSCGALLPGQFDPGKTCPDCGVRQHIWLIASY